MAGEKSGGLQEKEWKAIANRCTRNPQEILPLLPLFQAPLCFPQLMALHNAAAKRSLPPTPTLVHTLLSHS
ncbi:MAG: hypothetical protein SGCHY_004973, partial [Lobulomycetales sp.]